jgi:stage III sporulation protein AD
MEILKFAFVGIICAVLTVVVRQSKPELAIVVQLAGVTVIAFLAIEYLRNIFEQTNELFYGTELLSDGYLSLLVKILGIAVVTKIGSDICTDSSNTALATVVELVGKTIILAMCMSLIKTLAELAKGMLE